MEEEEGWDDEDVPVLMKVDHPFYYQILHREENSIIFAGECSKPSK